MILMDCTMQNWPHYFLFEWMFVLFLLDKNELKSKDGFVPIADGGNARLRGGKCLAKISEE
ncbi:hypothetical protein CWC12_19350 [Pseudoalteromonas ruthenica]|uniref:Uncharacterized protein n=1 Tax=Pseudoalteromonas ruthenica TaxID=151081 RepID=A0A0F4Q0T6_9GAMM|nr:hypothetical protein TW72_14285 [Pseudoalteromonas ruthenica]KJZ00950.1 hypothetical protein TW76_01810 [Pseudoalteromonas ruthenica]TMO83861.1 hypothetical protein CWC12_19350 [Pseudoalteromonas ruthenica]TMO92629.1 hypothetical protein CWC13_10910 [Pseudoalteromonas ruthenica]TMO95563.1 hypothetical protein CWC07_19025 [Pseudoalteromonas ruthenica]